jgi:hypothetical protein
LPPPLAVSGAARKKAFEENSMTDRFQPDPRPARPRPASALRKLALTLPLGLALASCGYNSSSYSGLTCSVPDQETWLAGLFANNYLWNATSPNYPPQTATIAEYFDSLLYTGGDPSFPAGVTDVWSSFTDDASFNRYWGSGDDLGYGLFVNGIEAQGTAGPLLVRYIDPGSPAAAAGIVRGDEITSINGVPAATVIANNDYSALSASSVGQTVTVATHNAAGDHSYTLAAAEYALTPVQGTRIVTTPGGRPMGYLMVTDMIDQALNPYDAAFGQFKAAGVQDVVIDLRYMGSGFVHDGEIMASYPAGPTTTGRVYANLYFNALLAPSANSFYTFDPYTNALSLSRVFVLTGPRTCAAAEQLVNGLRPYVGVVTIGDTTCGKPVGSTPASNCGTTYSPITFQITNGNNQGQYFGGISATCPVAENLAVPIGADGDPLLAGAETFADGGACPPMALTASTSAQRHASSLVSGMLEPGRRGSVSR